MDWLQFWSMQYELVVVLAYYSYSFTLRAACYMIFCIFWEQIGWILFKCCRSLWPLQMQQTKWCTTEHIAQYGHKQSVGSKIYLNGTKTRFFIWPGGRTHKLESVDIFPGNFLFSPLSVVAQNFLWLRWLFLVSSMAVELVIARVQTSKDGTKHVIYCLRSISVCKLPTNYLLCRLKDAPLSFCWGC